MSIRDTPWLRLRRRLGPVTRRVPYGHVVTESATYARLHVPGLPRPDRRFVIFAQGRSGSTLLADLLNRHPDVYCADEILTWERRDPARYAEACSIGHRARTYGFKVKIYQLTEAQQISDVGGWLADMHRRGWSIIHLQRSNVLRQALSSVVAEQRRLYHWEGPAAADPPPVHVDPDTVLRRAKERADFVLAEQRAVEGVPHVFVRYEDDLLRPETHQAAADRVFASLGLDPVPVATGLRRISDGTLERAVANAAALSSAVAASPFADLLARD